MSSKRKPFQTEMGHFLRRLDPTVRASLSETQLDAIRDAMGDVEREKQHTLDIRGIIPLFFARYYFVFLLGRDRRFERRDGTRRRTLAVVWGVCLSAIMLSPVIVFVFVLFYLVKLIFGVDLIPDSPPWRMFKP
jgi:hypothetical protein